MEDKSILELLEEYIEANNDLEYMKNAVENGDDDDQALSEYTNSEIPYREKSMKKIEKDLEKFPPFLLMQYRDSEEETRTSKKQELETKLSSIANSSYIGNQEPKEIRDLKSEIESCSVKIILLGKVLSNLGFDPKSPNQGSMTKRP